MPYLIKIISSLILITSFLPLHCQANSSEPFLFTSINRNNSFDLSGHTPTPRGIMLRSMVLPGWGQAVNHQWWKIPVIWGGFGACYYYGDKWNTKYVTFRDAYRYRTDNDPLTIDRYDSKNPLADTIYNDFQLKNYRDFYRRNLELTVIITAGVYLLNVVDAYVNAHLRSFDLDDDLSLFFKPFFQFEKLDNMNCCFTGLTINLKL